MKKLGLMMLLVACVAFVAKANMGEGVKVVLTSGDAKVFAGQKVVNVEYDYSSFGVGKFKTVPRTGLGKI